MPHPLSPRSVIATMLLALALGACDPRVDGELLEEDLTSASSGHTYHLYTFVPSAAAEQPARVLYVLDGDTMFNEAAEVVSERVAAGEIAPTIVVGIGYGDGDNARTRDYTPTSSPSVEGSGEADAFFTFVTDELIPHVDATRDTIAEREARALMGHSLGGLATLYALLTRSEHIHDFIALSPALMWDEQAIFSVEAQRAMSTTPIEAALYMGHGGFEAEGSRTAFEAMIDRLTSRDHDLTLYRHIISGGTHTRSRRANMERGVDLILGQEVRP